MYLTRLDVDLPLNIQAHFLEQSMSVFWCRQLIIHLFERELAQQLKLVLLALKYSFTHFETGHRDLCFGAQS